MKKIIFILIIFGLGLIAYEKVDNSHSRATTEKMVAVKIDRDIYKYFSSIVPEKVKETLMPSVEREFPDIEKGKLAKFFKKVGAEE